MIPSDVRRFTTPGAFVGCFKLVATLGKKGVAVRPGWVGWVKVKGLMAKSCFFLKFCSIYWTAKEPLECSKSPWLRVWKQVASHCSQEYRWWNDQKTWLRQSHLAKGTTVCRSQTKRNTHPQRKPLTKVVSFWRQNAVFLFKASAHTQGNQHTQMRLQGRYPKVQWIAGAIGISPMDTYHDHVFVYCLLLDAF